MRVTVLVLLLSLSGALGQLGDYIVFEPNSTTQWTVGENVTIVWEAPHSEPVTFFLTRDLMDLGEPIATGVEGLLENVTIIVPKVPTAGDYRIVLSLSPDGPSSFEVSSAPFGIGEAATTTGLPCNLGTSWTIPGVTTSPGFPPLPGACPGFPDAAQLSSISSSSESETLTTPPPVVTAPPNAPGPVSPSSDTGSGSTSASVILPPPNAGERVVQMSACAFAGGVSAMLTALLL